MIKSTVKFCYFCRWQPFCILYQTNGFVNIRWRGVSTSMHIGTLRSLQYFCFGYFIT